MSSQYQYVRAGQSQLYEVTSAGSVGWAAYVLPALPPGIQCWPAAITLVESLLLYQGHYVFSVRRPPTIATDPAGFAKQVIASAQKSVQQGNRALFWLNQFVPVDFGPLANFGVQVCRDGFNKFIIRADFNAQLGKSLEFYALTSLILEADHANGLLKIRTLPQQTG